LEEQEERSDFTEEIVRKFEQACDVDMTVKDAKIPFSWCAKVASYLAYCVNGGLLCS